MKLWKVSAGLVLLVSTFGGGYWSGYSAPRSDVDPQLYIETVFTPYADGLQSYLNFLDKAKAEIHIACYGFTEAAVADKLIELKKQRGISIHILLDRSQSGGAYQKKQIDRLLAAGIEVVIGTSEKSGQIMHHKYTVLDAEWVEDGSWNYTHSASKQANLMNFVRSKSRAAQFRANWQQMHRFMIAHQKH